MKKIFLYLIAIILISGCSTKFTPKIKELKNTSLIKKSFRNLDGWRDENYKVVVDGFIKSCQTKNTQKLYGSLCLKAKNTTNQKLFLQNNFIPYQILSKDQSSSGLLTGYYESELQGSLVETARFKYPIYETPDDLVEVRLGSIYPELRHYRLRGRLVNGKIIPYFTRKQTKASDINATVLCYTDSKIDRFFLEVQGSGRVTLRDGTVIYVGYANQNGHKYRSIGKYLVKIGAIKLQDISLQTIKKYLQENPSMIDKVLNYNKSVVYFQKKDAPSTGSLGVVLTPNRSVAVDRKFIPLGSMLYLEADINHQKVDRVVFAQDTGGAIKGAVRADMFLGYGDRAMNIAGELKSRLKLWILLPKVQR